MIYNLKAIRKQFLGLPLSEGDFERRGFDKGNDAQHRLEDVGKTVMMGYNTAIETGLHDDLKTITGTIQSEKVGFFHEGLAMGLYTLDIFSLFKRDRFWKFVKNQAKHHEYMSYIGAGLAIGVFNRPFESFIKKACPMCGCLVVDGIGFYHAFFKTKKTLIKYKVPLKVEENRFYLERFDNGVGRAIWFYNSGKPLDIAKTVKGFPADRRGNIWSGIGLAATYAGGVSDTKIRLLQKMAGEHVLMLGQGSFLAAHTRQRAGNPKIDESTVEILTGDNSMNCDELANEIMEVLDKRRYIDNKHSFQVFLEHVRDWIGSKITRQDRALLTTI